MEVPVSAFRAQLKHWIAQAHEGETVVLTDRGIPVAKVVPVESAGLLEELQREGILSAPAAPVRPRAVESEPLTPRGAPAGGLVRRLRRQG